MTPTFDSVIAVVGLKAAGKDLFCLSFESRGYHVLRISDAIRYELAKKGEPNPPVSRLQQYSNARKRAADDPGLWGGEMMKLAAERRHRWLVINGIRNPGEFEAIERHASGVVTRVGIIASTSVRAERFLARHQAGDPTTYDEFLAIDNRDRGAGEDRFGQRVDKCLQMVPPANIFDNSGTLQSFHAWISALYSRHPKPQLAGLFTGEFGEGEPDKFD